ncbi:aspartic peptidase A1 [Collybia nuda]|uniref:Aspartic peptidase A1 n=1 Tax=Collybia nuda TaxID=64659 RepID=A0A9P5YF45_9AGAR|nr:aspartic peptidase A1 [Collybia nuda]
MWSSFALFLFLDFFIFVSAKSLVPRLDQLQSQSDPITIPIRMLSPRAFAENDNIGSGITPVTMSMDRQSYFAVIKIGDINFRVVLDTASSDLWVMSSDCNTHSCTTVPRYPLAYQSPTFTTIDGNSTQFLASYADGTTASGFVAKERVQFANLTIQNQVFGMVTNCNVTMTDQTSGIIGLGFPRLSSIPSSVTNSTPFFLALAQQGLLDYPLFGFSLTRNATGTLSIGDFLLTFLPCNASHISWNNVAEFSPFSTESNSSSYLQWVIPIQDLSVNGTQITPTPTFPASTHNSSLALFDIGAPGIYGPFPDVSRVFDLIDGARLVDPNGQWAVPCDTVVPMTFAFGGHNYTVQPSDYIIGPATGNPNICLSWPRALPPSADGIDWQMGNAFLRTVYSIYSYGINSKEPPMIGLYPLRNATDKPETTDSVASILSSISATVATTIPNFLLPTPTFTTPAYAFNTSVSAAIGGIVSSGLAPSTYRPILGNLNVSAIPTISPSPTLVTLVVTDGSGAIATSIQSMAAVSVTLGVPPGWNAAHTLHMPLFTTFMVLIIPWTLVYMTDIFVYV